MVESMKARRRRRKHEQWAAEEKAKKVEGWDLKYKSLTIQELYKVKSTITGRNIELYDYLENLIIDRELDLPIEIPKIDFHKQKLRSIIPAPVPVPVIEITAVEPVKTIIKPEIVAKPLGIPNTPPIFTGFKDAKNYYIPKEKSWLEKLINWFAKLFGMK